METHPVNAPRVQWSLSLGAALFLMTVVVLSFSLYANLSVFVSRPSEYCYFPPFRAGENRNQNNHLGAEYYSIAKAIVEGRGFSDPFQSETGPTAWMPPGLVWILAGFHWLAAGNREVVTVLFVLLQDLTLVFVGAIVLLVGQATTRHVWLPSLLLLGAFCYYFRHCFQFTHDCFLVTGLLSLLLGGFVLGQPLQRTWRGAAGWGLIGGICALCSPIVGFSWGILTLAQGWQAGRRRNLTVALLLAALTVSPWVIRNYLVFGRFIPVKSNLAYELFQSQCLQYDGLLRDFSTHPWGTNNFERQDYQRLGEMAFLDARRDQFLESVAKDPFDFADRVANRFFAATLWYMPFDAREGYRQPVFFWITRIVFPLPFLAVLFLLLTAPWKPLTSAHWTGIGIYFTYLMPYVVVSYYDRYKAPLLAIEVVLVLWALDRLLRWFATRSNFSDDLIAEVVLEEEAIVADPIKKGEDSSARSSQRTVPEHG